MKARQFFFVTLAVLTVLTLSGGVGYYYATHMIHDRTVVLQQKLASETVIEDQINELVDLKQSYQKLIPVIPQIEAALPRQKMQSEVALQIQKLASDAGMSLPSVSFTGSSALPSSTSQTIKAGSALSLPLSFQLSGTYSQLQAFLRSLEQLNRYTGVTNLNITHADSGKLNFTINASVYIKP